MAASGWAKFAWDRYTDSPKVVGRICQLSIGNLMLEGVEYTLFTPFLYLTNKRKHNVHVLAYRLGVDAGKGYESVDRVFGAESIKKSIEVETANHILKIANVGRAILINKTTQIEYGKPSYGILLFGSKKKRGYFEGKVKGYRITIEDVLGNNHCIEHRTEKDKNPSKPFMNLFLLPELFGVELTRKKTA